MNPVCPNYIAPRYYIDPKTDEDIEGTAMCSLVDKPCLVEYGETCEEYNDWQKEEQIFGKLC